MHHLFSSVLYRHATNLYRNKSFINNLYKKGLKLIHIYSLLNLQYSIAHTSFALAQFPFLSKLYI